jgi:monothiol glutaredoxin
MIEEITPASLRAMLDAGETFQLIDVRVAWERHYARIDPSTLLTAEITQSLLAEPPDERVVFYCHHGVRSWDWARFFADRGMPRPCNLTGGIEAWSLEVDPSVPRY